MWQAQQAPLLDGSVHMVRVHRDGEPLAFGNALRALRDDESARRFFIAQLAAAPFSAYRFETPALRAATINSAFEFVLVCDPSLERPAHAAAFAQHLATDQSVVGFANLGADAYLLIPTRRGPADAYAHLGAFTRSAPDEQQHQLWQRTAAALLLRINEKPIWLSTAGGGVPWLHVRLDTRPKYYLFKPYKTPG